MTDDRQLRNSGSIARRAKSLLITLVALFGVMAFANTSEKEHWDNLANMYAEYIQYSVEPRTLRSADAQALYEALSETVGAPFRASVVANEYKFGAFSYDKSVDELQRLINKAVGVHRITGARRLQVIVQTPEGRAFLGFDNADEARAALRSIRVPYLTFDEWLATLPASVRNPDYDWEARRQREAERATRRRNPPAPTSGSSQRTFGVTCTSYFSGNTYSVRCTSYGY